MGGAAVSAASTASSDGGATWTPALQIDENTGVTDLEFDPSNPDVVYAAGIPAAPPRLGLPRRRSLVGHLEVDRQRQDLAQGDERPARRETWERSVSR